jgi:hypothetical protein
MKNQYRVTSALATVKTASPSGFGMAGRGGRTTVTLYHGSLLPDDIEPAALEHLLSLNVVELVTEPDPEPQAA